MNMPAKNYPRSHIYPLSHIENTTFIADAVIAVETIKSQQSQEKQTKSKALLDTIFPLNTGTHLEATSYMLDGRHLMVYFKGGAHTGLLHAGQFVAFTGHKAHPDSLLLRSHEGCYIEISFTRGTNEGNQTSVEISDIQLETCASFASNHYHSHVNDNGLQHSESHVVTQGVRHWISLVHNDQHGQPRAYLDDKDFTAKNGEDYCLTRCFKKITMLT